MLAMQLLAAAGMSVALAGCVFDGSPQARTGGGPCVISGCSAEVCSDQAEITPCIWRDAYACFRAARCERQAGGACDWTQTSELEACLAAHDPPPQ
jgi:hypothetical protein